MKHVVHIFFDLDHTLWDFEKNAKETLTELFSQYRQHLGETLDFGRFYAVYSTHNQQLWKEYRENRIDTKFLRTERWRRTFDELGIMRGEWVDAFGADYILQCPKKGHLIPGARELLDHLLGKYSLHLITNGFEETQMTKLLHSDLEKYFQVIVTSDKAGAKKPDPRIFQYALEATGAEVTNSVYIGDHYDADIRGSLNFGLPAIFFNPFNEENPDEVTEIKDLPELIQLFNPLP